MLVLVANLMQISNDTSQFSLRLFCKLSAQTSPAESLQMKTPLTKRHLRFPKQLENFHTSVQNIKLSNHLSTTEYWHIWLLNRVDRLVN